MPQTPPVNTLFYGDNLRILRDHIADESVDLIYLDPPFNSNATYNVLFRSPAGEQSQAQIEAFEDTWHWNEAAERAFDDVMKCGNSDAAEMLRAMRSFLKENDMMAYLAMMAVRLIQLHRVLKPTGSLYLHCDPTASHYLKLLLDAIFGPSLFLNEIVWKRTHSHGSSKRYGPVHDIILFYSKTDAYLWTDPRGKHDPAYVEKHFRLVDPTTGELFQPITLTGSGVRHGESGQPWKGVNPTEVGRHWALPGAILKELGITEGTVQQRLDALDKAGRIYWPKTEDGTPRLKWFVSDLRGVAIPDVWADIAPISAQAKERLGYPTQKPIALLERIISASSNEGDLVLDPFCGCGTTVHAAQKLNRRWIGIDITHLAIALIRRRLIDAFPQAQFEVHGVPKDVDGARALAKADPHQFQLWALSMLEAQPYKGGKKGADRGIDGYLYFKPDGKMTEKAIVSVKGGEHVSDTMVKDLIATVDHENAKMGVFVTLTPPTQPMKTRAVAAGFYETEYGQFPKIQILTIEDLFKGMRPHMPWIDASVFKKAKREQTSKQNELDL
jgi:site-specific DNA-methyltransferase (adenine-specific)